MATNDFIPFATGIGANVESQASYLTDPQTAAGQQPGIARSAFNNKVLRQAAFIASCVAQTISNITGEDVLDNGVTADCIATMTQAWANPSGAITMFGGTSVPTGFLLCDGSAVSRSTYANLFSVIGTANGIGDGASTFNLPDMRGQFPRGVSGASGNDPDASARLAVNGGNAGNAVGSIQPDQFLSHTHSVGIDSGPGATTIGSGGTPSAGTVMTTASGGNETRPKNVYVNFIIKI